MTKRAALLWLAAVVMMVSGAAGFWITLTDGGGLTFLLGVLFGAALVYVEVYA